jgi:hypothetical protein
MNPYKLSLFGGKNNLGSYELFLKRKFYQGFALSSDPSPKILIDEVKDLRFAEKALHGKINSAGIPILPRYEKLSTFPGKDIICSDFVTAAFLDLKSAIDMAILRGEISSSDPIFKNFDAIGGFFDANTAYKTYLTAFRKLFISYVDKLPKDKKGNFDNFSVFVDLFLEFFETFSTSFPITKTAFIMSGMISNQCSGLMVETAEYDYSSDEEKVKDFYKSRNFKHYKEACIKYGFLIDKGAPWRIIADIDNPAMQSYINVAMSTETFNEVSFFETYFAPVIGDDLPALKRIIYDLYVATVMREKIETNITTSKGCFEVSTRRRSIKSFIQAQKTLSAEEWMHLFLKIKNLETKMEYSTDDLRQMAKNAADLNKVLDNASYLSYINNRFSPISISEGSLNYEITKMELRKSGKNEQTLSKEIKKQARIKKRTLY